MTMLFLRYMLLITGFGMLAAAAAVLVYDLYMIFKGRKPVHSESRPPVSLSLSPGAHEERRIPSLREAPVYPVRWRAARKLALTGAAPILASLSIAVIPSGSAGVRVSQISGPSPRTLYPGV